jgi:lipoprotein-releasing system permease protein
MIGGVCGGLGRYFDVNPVFYRIGFVVLTLLGGAGILIYGAALLVIPNEGENDSIAADVLRNHRQRPFALLGLALVIAAAHGVRPERVAAVAAEVRQALAGTPVSIIDWQQSNNSFFTAVQVEQNVMFIILALIILVAAFNVISSLIMMVKDKTRDIAVLRTIGAGRGAVMRIFLMCGASVGVTGTVIGTILGIVFTLNIDRIQDAVQSLTGVNVFNAEVYYLTHLPARLDGGEVAKVVAMALVLSLLATLYPSWRAARTDPVEALRHE